MTKGNAVMPEKSPKCRLSLVPFAAAAITMAWMTSEITCLFCVLIDALYLTSDSLCAKKMKSLYFSA